MERQWDNMAICTATKHDGNRCTAPAKAGSHFCGRHGGVVDEVARGPMCRHRYHWRGRSKRCTKDATTEGFCQKHHEIEERRRKRRESAQWMTRVWDEMMRMVWEENDIVRAARFLNVHEEQGHFYGDHYVVMGRRFGNEIAHYDQVERLLGRRRFDEPVFPPIRDYDVLLDLADQDRLWVPQGTPDRPGMAEDWLEDRVLPPAPPEHAGEVGRLAFDPQNVHTREVNGIVNESLDILLSVSEPVNGFKGYWEAFPLTRDNRTMYRDMEKWYNTQSCRSEDDWMYRRVLDGLWTLIIRSPFKDELMVRLTQELDESVATCCDGHIARLCNVMVGFDEAFKTPISVVEVLGDRIGAIAARELTIEEKVVEAWTAFEELSIDHETRKEWISAL